MGQISGLSTCFTAFIWLGLWITLVNTCPEQCLCLKTVTRCILQKLTRIPPDIPRETTVLDLRFNNIRHIASGSFANLHYVHTLLLNNNELQLIDSGGFEGLRNLKSLYIYRNKLSRIDAGDFQGLFTLENLYAHLNEIRFIHPDAFVHTPNLVRLYLNDNNLKMVPHESVESLQFLKKLRLDSNALNCDCESLRLAEYLKKHPDIEARPTDCMYPVKIRGKMLTAVPMTHFHCQMPKIKEGPHSLEVRYGAKAVNFECKVEGSPQPEIIWLYNNTVLSKEMDLRYNIMPSGTLEIRNPTEKDEGFYECIAKSPMGATRGKRAQLRYRPPDNQITSGLPVIVRPPQDTEIAIGDSLRLQCQGRGYPVPASRWSKDGVIFAHESEKVAFLADGGLLIRRVTKSDAGEYTCEVWNNRGRITESATVRVQYPPEFTLRPNDLVEREGIEIKWPCEAQGYPEAQISWLKNNQPLRISRRVQLEENGSILKIYPLMKQDVGRYSCRAYNRLGSVVTSAVLRISESISPRITIGPDNLFAKPGNVATFNCEATGQPRPDIIWSFNGSPIPTVRGHYEVTSSNSLRINGVTPEDAGHYSCQAVNSVGAMSADAKLTIEKVASDVVDPSLSNQVTPELIRNSVLEATQNVDRAINATRRNLYDGKPKSPGEILALFRFPRQQAVELARAREIYEETLFIIQQHVRRGLEIRMEEEKNVSYESVFSVSHLQMIMELSGCTAHQFRNPCDDMCFHLKYRSYDGQCNNLQDPMYGASLTPFNRVLPPIYENGFNTPVGWDPGRLYYGFPKPNPRSVSVQMVSSAEITPDSRYSSMLMQWGQFLDHDLDFVAGAASRQVFAGGALCNLTCNNRAPCFNIRLPRDDPRHRLPVQPCIEFERSSAVCGSGETSIIFRNIAPRQQLNQITSFIDGSQVYGSTEQEALDLRDLFSDHGSLRFDIVSHSQKAYLPFNRDAPMDCQRNWTQNHPIRCFLAGDYRANEQLGLLSMHTLWLRQHNRLAARFIQINPHWDGEKIYQETRKIVGAQLQHITYAHWLPKILGPVEIQKLGHYRNYQPSTNPAIANAFATAAFRFGHGLINPVLYRFNANLTRVPEGHLPLHQAFFAPERLLSEGGIDPIIRGLFASPSKAPRSDQLMNKELTEKLFLKAHEVALDLAALNIQRGRDHALPGYTTFRHWCNLSASDSWEDLQSDIPNAGVLQKLRELYGDPRNIDLWVGGMVERLVTGGRVGPTFACIIGDQFRRTRDGDRFWYEKSGVFTDLQRDEIRKTTLASVICDNSDGINRVQSDVFVFPGSRDPQLYSSCDFLPSLNLNLWQDCCSSSISCQAQVADDDNFFAYELGDDNQAERGGAAVNTQTHHGRIKRSVFSSNEASSKNLKPHETGLESAEDSNNWEIEERIEGLEELMEKLKHSLSSMEHKLRKLSENDKLNNKRCTIEPGIWKNDREKWNLDICTSCACQSGQIWCSTKSCPPIQCSNPVKLPFMCCQSC